MIMVNIIMFQKLKCNFFRMIFYFATTTRENVRENWATLVFQSSFTEPRLLSLLEAAMQ